MFEGKNLIIFDLDHTIGALDVDWASCEAEIREYLSSNYGETFTSMFAELNDITTRNGEKCRKDTNAIFLKHEMRNIGNFMPFPQITGIINSLQGKQLAVFSANQEATIRKALEIAGISEKFGIILGRDSVSRTKPDPEAIMEILKRTGAPKQLAVMVGDSWTDEESSRKAGIGFIHVEAILNATHS